MNNEKYERIKNFRLKCLLYCWALAVLLNTTGLANDTLLAGDSQSRSVLYQVTYSDRRIVNLTTPPAAEKGILLVTRITATSSALPGYETRSTGNTPIEEFNPQRTVEQQMRWNGSQWVVGSSVNAKITVARLQGPQGRTAVRIQNVLHWITESGNHIKDAQARLKASKASEAILLTLRDLKHARQTQRQATMAVGELKANLLHGEISVGSFPPPRKHVLPYNAVEMLTAPGNQPVLRSEVNIGGYFGDRGRRGWKSNKWRWPVAGNVDVYQETPNPDYDTGPRVIIREQK